MDCASDGVICTKAMATETNKSLSFIMVSCFHLERHHAEPIVSWFTSSDGLCLKSQRVAPQSDAECERSWRAKSSGKVGRFSTFKDATNINGDLPEHVGNAGSAAVITSLENTLNTPEERVCGHLACRSGSESERRSIPLIISTMSLLPHSSRLR